tara:strand:- start:1041 stop:1382 length:342 start_codon:yes stop_codon:yes gene_type:complete
MTKINKKVAIQFFRGKDEEDHPEIRLFRNNDGKKGKVIYKFYKPSTITFENFKSIQKMYLIDEEGALSTRKIDLSIADNNIKQVHSTYSWNSEKEFERFMRFAQRYADSILNY